MSGNITLYSSLPFVSLLVCSTIMLFIKCSDVVSASHTTTQAENGVKQNILRSLFTPNSQHHPLSTGLLSTETGLQTGTYGETEKSRDSREALTITDHQSSPLRFSKISYNQNSPDRRQPRTGITSVQRGHSTGGVRPASSIFTDHSQHRGQSFGRPQSSLNYQPLSQKVAQIGNSYNSQPLINRKSSQKEACSPFHRSSCFSQVWDPKEAQKSYNERNVLRNNSPKLADKTSWPLQTGEYRSTSLPREHYSGYKETNKLSAVRGQSTFSGIQSNKFLSFANQTASNAPSISNGLDASVIKRNPSPEKVTTSITDFSQGLNTVSSSETLKHKKVHSYLFKDSQTSFDTVNTVTGGGQEASSGLSSFTTMPPKLRPSDVQVYSRFASGFKQLHRKDPVKEDNADPLYLNTNGAQDGSQTGSLTKYQLISSTYPPAQLSLHPASGKGRTVESYVPIGHAASKDHYAASSERSFVGSPVSTTTRGSLHGYKPGRSTKSIYGIRGFKNPLGKDPSILSSSEMTNSRRYSFDKGRDYKLNIRNIYPSLLSKYRFGQRGGSTMTTTPAKLYRTSIDYLPFSSDSLDLIHTTTVSTPRLFTSGSNDVQPERDASTDSNPDHRQFRNYKRIYSLKGFGTQPLEGAKTLVREPDKSAALQQGFEIRSSQIWQPERSGIHRWYSETGEREPETSNIYTHRRNELSSEDFKPPIKTAGSTESVPHSRFMPDTYRKNRKIYTSPLGFQSIQNKIGNEHKKSHWKYAEQNPTIASPIHRVSSARLRSAGGLKVKSSPTSEPRTPNENKPAAMKASLLNSSTSSTVRGKRVKGKHINSKKLNESTSLTSDSGNLAIVRVHKRPAEFKAVTFADVLGSASFSSVRATTQAPVTAADKDYFPNSAAMTKQKEGGGQWTLNADDGVHSRENTSGSPEANAADEVEDFSTVGEQELGFKSREFDSGMKTFDAFLDNEGNGSGIFNQSDVLPTDTTKTQGFSEDLLELDYLRISTGNISFKSVKLSHAEK